MSGKPLRQLSRRNHRRSETLSKGISRNSKTLKICVKICSRACIFELMNYVVKNIPMYDFYAIIMVVCNPRLSLRIVIKGRQASVVTTAATFLGLYVLR